MFRKIHTTTACLIVLATGSRVFSQVRVTDMSFKLKAFHEEVMYFAFAPGDSVSVDLSIAGGRELREFEILEYPSTSVVMHYRVRDIKGKILRVQRASVYAFRFRNRSPFGRICSLKIERYPSHPDLRNYNTGVVWVEKLDTVWKIRRRRELAKSDTILLEKRKKVLVDSKLVEERALEKQELVHSKLHLTKDNLSAIAFSIPGRTNDNLTERRVVSWAYWIGVGKESQEAWQKNTDMMVSLISTATAGLTTPLGAFMVGAITQLLCPANGNKIAYQILDGPNYSLYSKGLSYTTCDNGEGVASYKKFVESPFFETPRYILLQNDNLLMPVSVHVSVALLVRENKHAWEYYKQPKVKKSYVKRVERYPIVKMVRVPLPINTNLMTVPQTRTVVGRSE